MKTLKKITLLSFLIGSMMTMTIFAQAQGPIGTPTLSENVNFLPYLSAGHDVSICNDRAFKTLGETSIEGTTYWISMGDGTFENPFNLKTIYTPGPHDIADGQVSLTLHIIPQAMNSIPMMDEVVIYLNNCINIEEKMED